VTKISKIKKTPLLLLREGDIYLHKSHDGMCLMLVLECTDYTGGIGYEDERYYKVYYLDYMQVRRNIENPTGHYLSNDDLKRIEVISRAPRRKPLARSRTNAKT